MSFYLIFLFFWGLHGLRLAKRHPPAVPVGGDNPAGGDNPPSAFARQQDDVREKQGMPRRKRGEKTAFYYDNWHVVELAPDEHRELLDRNVLLENFEESQEKEDSGDSDRSPVYVSQVPDASFCKSSSREIRDLQNMQSILSAQLTKAGHVPLRVSFMRAIDYHVERLMKESLNSRSSWKLQRIMRRTPILLAKLSTSEFKHEVDSNEYKTEWKDTLTNVANDLNNWRIDLLKKHDLNKDEELTKIMKDVVVDYIIVHSSAKALPGCAFQRVLLNEIEAQLNGNPKEMQTLQELVPNPVKARTRQQRNTANWLNYYHLSYPTDDGDIAADAEMIRKKEVKVEVVRKRLENAELNKKIKSREKILTALDKIGELYDEDGIETNKLREEIKELKLHAVEEKASISDLKAEGKQLAKDLSTFQTLARTMSPTAFQKLRVRILEEIDERKDVERHIWQCYRNVAFAHRDDLEKGLETASCFVSCKTPEGLGKFFTRQKKLMAATCLQQQQLSDSKPNPKSIKA